MWFGSFIFTHDGVDLAAGVGIDLICLSLGQVTTLDCGIKLGFDTG